MEEKRRTERYELHLPTKIMVISRKNVEENTTINLHTKDICDGGAYFSTTEPLPEGTKVSIELQLPLNRFERVKEKSAKFRVNQGVVLRAEQKGMAIGFSKGFEIAPQELVH